MRRHRLFGRGGFQRLITDVAERCGVSVRAGGTGAQAAPGTAERVNRSLSLGRLIAQVPEGLRVLIGERGDVADVRPGGGQGLERRLGLFGVVAHLRQALRRSFGRPGDVPDLPARVTDRLQCLGGFLRVVPQ